ncbi:hypothetical protein X798_02629, partial [Onchocerca flexuosa]
FSFSTVVDSTNFIYNYERIPKILLLQLSCDSESLCFAGRHSEYHLCEYLLTLYLRLVDRLGFYIVENAMYRLGGVKCVGGNDGINAAAVVVMMAWIRTVNDLVTFQAWICTVNDSATLQPNVLIRGILSPLPVTDLFCGTARHGFSDTARARRCRNITLAF